jgi:hypothetical protein
MVCGTLPPGGLRISPLVLMKIESCAACLVAKLAANIPILASTAPPMHTGLTRCHEIRQEMEMKSQHTGVLVT